MASKVPRNRGSGQQGRTELLIQKTQTVQHTGPLPSPQTLADYESLHPGTAARIIAMAENEQSARHLREATAQQADIDHRSALVAIESATRRSAAYSETFGQVCGLLVALGCICAATYAIHLQAGALVVAACLSIPVVGIINAIRHGRKDDAPGGTAKRERD